MKHISTFENFLNEGDMTNYYDGFIVSSTDNKIKYKARYMKGVRNNKAEDIAIEKIMKKEGKPRSYFWVTGGIDKGTYDKDTTPEIA